MCHASHPPSPSSSLHCFPNLRDESLRRCDVIRTPKEEGTWSVQFRHEPSCSWVVKVDANYDETSLRDELHYDLERERYVYVQQWAALVDHTPAEK